MTLKLPLAGKKQATLVSVYAPTMTNSNDIKDKFYEDLDSIITSTPSSDKLIILGDFNASTQWEVCPNRCQLSGNYTYHIYTLADYSSVSQKERTSTSLCV